MDWHGKTVALVGRMIANSNALGWLKTALEEKGAKVNALLGDSKGVLNVSDGDLWSAIKGANIAVIGMGHPGPEPDYKKDVSEDERRTATMCGSAGIPYFLYADNPVFGGGVFRRPWFANVLSGAAGVFVPKASDADDAKQYKSLLNVIATGNPTHEDMGRVGLCRAEARLKYCVEPQEVVMIVSFTKDPNLNKDITAAAIAAAELNSDRDWLVFLCLHPGDPSSTADYIEFTNLIPDNVSVTIAISPKAAKAQNEKLADSGVMPLPIQAGKFDENGSILVEATDSLVDAADVIIDPTGSAMVARSAMHRPDHYIRVITIFTPEGLKRAGLERPEDAEFARDGTAPSVMIHTLSDALEAVMFAWGFAPYRQKQLELYATPPPKGTAVGKMIAALEDVFQTKTNDECGTCGCTHR